MPTGEIRASDVADFAAFDESVESRKSFFDRSKRVEAVYVVDVDVIDAEAAEALVAGLEKVMARGAEIVGAVAHGERGFRGDEHAIALAGDGFAEDFLGRAARVDVGGVKKIDAGFKTYVNKASGFGDVAAAPGFEEFGGAAKGASTETKNGNLKAGMAKLSEFHGGLDAIGNAQDTAARRELVLDRPED